MPPKKQPPPSNTRLIVGAVLLVGAIGAAYWIGFGRNPVAPPDSSAALSDKIVERCAGGLDQETSSEVKAGLADFISSIHANTTRSNKSLGAVIGKISANAVGADIYKQYQECIKLQTILGLWPNGKVPPEFLDLINPKPAPPKKYSEEERATDINRIQQLLVDHGAVRRTDFWRRNENVSQTANFTRDQFSFSRFEEYPDIEPGGTMKAPENTSYTADLARISPTTILRRDKFGWIIDLSCVEGDCFTQQTSYATGKGNLVPEGDSAKSAALSIYLGFGDDEVGAKSVLNFRRALARLVTPDHSDASVCEAVANNPDSPKCSKQD